MWSHNGRYIAIPYGHSVEIKDSTTLDTVFWLEGHMDAVFSVAWSHDDTKIATTGNDQTVKIWDSQNGNLITTLTGHDEAVTNVIWSQVNGYLFSSGREQRDSLFIWDTQVEERIGVYEAGSIADSRFSPDGQEFVYVFSNHLEILDSVSFETLADHQHSTCCSNIMYSVNWHPYEQKIVTGSVDGLITVWDANTAEQVSQFPANTQSPNEAASWVRDVIYSPDGSTILAVSGDGTVAEWDAETGVLLQSTQIEPLATATWSPYGVRLAVVNLVNQNGARLSDWNDFDGSQSVSEVNIIVPFASVERLQNLMITCGVNAEAARETTGENLQSLQDEIETLPLSCQTEIAAMEEAINR